MCAALTAKRNLWTYLGLGVLAAASAVSIILLSRGDDAWQGSPCSRLKETCLTLDMWHDVYKSSMPFGDNVNSEGRKLSSWRLWLYKFTGAGRYITLSESWDSDVHSRFRDTGAYMFCIDDDDPRTNVVAITGPGTIWTNWAGGARGRPAPGTLIMIDVAEWPVHWAEPGDCQWKDFQNLNLMDGNRSPRFGVDQDVLCLCFGDGSVWQVSRRIPPEKLIALCMDEAEDRREELLSGWIVQRIVR